ncbi:hypothetical protein Vretimale_14730 [Volvox reticuliferus]|uniref:Uncharacterized protein n=1 Tax=Volvox reticuliferus TaxID=1737510 RepID=A0A8J4GMQ0_9CHLO|nr:hypothetical protein Vretimale_14730 [Volvox reticuliferus]
MKAAASIIAQQQLNTRIFINIICMLYDNNIGVQWSSSSYYNLLKQQRCRRYHAWQQYQQQGTCYLLPLLLVWCCLAALLQPAVAPAAVSPFLNYGPAVNDMNEQHKAMLRFIASGNTSFWSRPEVATRIGFGTAPWRCVNICDGLSFANVDDCAPDCQGSLEYCKPGDPIPADPRYTCCAIERLDQSHNIIHPPLSTPPPWCSVYTPWTPSSYENTRPTVCDFHIYAAQRIKPPLGFSDPFLAVACKFRAPILYRITGKEYHNDTATRIMYGNDVKKYTRPWNYNIVSRLALRHMTAWHHPSINMTEPPEFSLVDDLVCLPLEEIYFEDIYFRPEHEGFAVLPDRRGRNDTTFDLWNYKTWNCDRAASLALDLKDFDLAGSGNRQELFRNYSYFTMVWDPCGVGRALVQRNVTSLNPNLALRQAALETCLFWPIQELHAMRWTARARVEWSESLRNELVSIKYGNQSFPRGWQALSAPDPTASRNFLPETLRRLTIKRTNDGSHPSRTWRGKPVIKGFLPSEWALFKNLEYLDLSDDMGQGLIEGPIPSTWLMMTKLRTINLTGHPNFCKDWHRIVLFQHFIRCSWALKQQHQDNSTQADVLIKQLCRGPSLFYAGAESLDPVWGSGIFKQNISIFDMDGVGWQWYDPISKTAGYTNVIAPDGKCCWDTYSEQFRARNFTIKGPTADFVGNDYFWGSYLVLQDFCERASFFPIQPKATGRRPPIPPVAPKPPEIPPVPPLTFVDNKSYPYIPLAPNIQISNLAQRTTTAPPQPMIPPSFPGKWSSAWSWLPMLPPRPPSPPSPRPPSPPPPSPGPPSPRPPSPAPSPRPPSPQPPSPQPPSPQPPSPQPPSPPRPQLRQSPPILPPATPPLPFFNCSLAANNKIISFAIPSIARGPFYIVIAESGSSSAAMMNCRACGCNVSFTALARGTSSLYKSSSGPPSQQQPDSSFAAAVSTSPLINDNNNMYNNDDLTTADVESSREIARRHLLKRVVSSSMYNDGDSSIQTNHLDGRKLVQTFHDASTLPSLEELIGWGANMSGTAALKEISIIDMPNIKSGKLMAAWRMEPAHDGDYLVRIQVGESVWYRWVTVDLEAPHISGELFTFKTTMALSNNPIAAAADEVVAQLRYLILTLNMSEPVKLFNLGSVLQLSGGAKIAGYTCFKSAERATEVVNVAQAALKVTAAAAAAAAARPSSSPTAGPQAAEYLSSPAAPVASAPTPTQPYRSNGVLQLSGYAGIDFAAATGVPYARSCLVLMYTHDNNSAPSVTLPEGVVADLTGNPSVGALLLQTKLPYSKRFPIGPLANTASLLASASIVLGLVSRWSVLQSTYHIQMLAMTANMASPGLSFGYRWVARHLRWSILSLKGNIPPLDEAFRNPTEFIIPDEVHDITLISTDPLLPSMVVPPLSPTSSPSSLNETTAAREILSDHILESSSSSSSSAGKATTSMEGSEMMNPSFTNNPSFELTDAQDLLVTWLQNMSEVIRSNISDDSNRGCNSSNNQDATGVSGSSSSSSSSKPINSYVIGGAAAGNRTIVDIDFNGKVILNSTAGASDCSTLAPPAAGSSGNTSGHIAVITDPQDLGYTVVVASVLVGALVVGHAWFNFLYRRFLSRDLPAPFQFPRAEMTLGGLLQVSITFYSFFALGAPAAQWSSSWITAVIALVLFVAPYLGLVWWLTVCRWYLEEKPLEPPMKTVDMRTAPCDDEGITANRISVSFEETGDLKGLTSHACQTDSISPSSRLEAKAEDIMMGPHWDIAQPGKYMTRGLGQPIITERSKPYLVGKAAAFTNFQLYYACSECSRACRTSMIFIFNNLPFIELSRMSILCYYRYLSISPSLSLSLSLYIYIYIYIFLKGSHAMYLDVHIYIYVCVCVYVRTYIICNMTASHFYISCVVIT